MTAWWKCCIPVSAWFVCIAVIAPKTYFQCWKCKTCPGKTFMNPNFPFRDLITFPSPTNGSVSEHQPHAILAVCKHCLISLKAFATWRRGSENSGQFGQLDVVVIQSARLGDSPLAASQDPAVATSEPQKCLCHQASNDRIQTTKYLMRDKHQCLRNIILLIISAFRSYIWCKRKDVQLTVVTVTPGNQHPFRGL